MKSAALVVVDLQNDFILGSLAVADADRIILPIRELVSMHQWRLVVATRDWHPKNHTSFALQHGVEPYLSVTFVHPETHSESKVHTVWPDHCVQDTEGAKLELLFATAFHHLKSNHALVSKGYLQDREYYLCFQDTWGVHHTEMEQLLKENDIEEVYFCGLAYDFCVFHSATDCAKLGYKTSVLKDCTRAVYPEKDTETDARFRAAGVTISSAENVKY